MGCHLLTIRATCEVSVPSLQMCPRLTWVSKPSDQEAPGTSAPSHSPPLPRGHPSLSLKAVSPVAEGTAQEHLENLLVKNSNSGACRSESSELWLLLSSRCSALPAFHSDPTGLPQGDRSSVSSPQWSSPSPNSSFFIHSRTSTRRMGYPTFRVSLSFSINLSGSALMDTGGGVWRCGFPVPPLLSNNHSEA